MTLADPKVFMEAMLSKMRHVMKVELEQVHERIDQMESARERQPQNVPNLRRRERVQPREVRVKDEEPYGAGFDQDDDRDFAIRVQWLSTLGPILWDFVKLCMEFNLLDSKHVLQGIIPMEVSMMDREQFGKAMKQDKQGLVLQLLPPDAIHIFTLETDPFLLNDLTNFR
ncbi:hypothetical protein F0562_007515 [Nyssa sinensis]|uniref:Uncharacterized protein n=1 Tax=Nyssa sinensis TaxID=561372 RepID=A0A5J5A5C0_9ASTE|nr:hypothetical protein F0562_007515 [Nyssa sinensis]